jgi:hypothetical protein
MRVVVVAVVRELKMITIMDRDVETEEMIVTPM